MMRGELLVAVVDGQGGGMGRGLVEAVKNKWPSLHVRALGTNSLATAAMLRAGADDGATGENAVAFNARRADILLGPIGVLTPNGLLGEVSAAMAAATLGSYHVFYQLLQSNTIATLLAICIAVAVYGLVMLLIKGIVEEDLQTVPGGGKLIRVCRRLHLL